MPRRKKAGDDLKNNDIVRFNINKTLNRTKNYVTKIQIFVRLVASLRILTATDASLERHNMGPAWIEG